MADNNFQSGLVEKWDRPSLFEMLKMISSLSQSSTNNSRDIYSGNSPSPPGGKKFFVQIEKQGRIWRGTWEKEKGGKKEKSDKTHVKIPLWSLNTSKKEL